MESSLKEFNVFIVTKTSKEFLGNALSATPQQAKAKVLELLNTKVLLEGLKSANVEYSIVVELDSTHAIFK